MTSNKIKPIQKRLSLLISLFFFIELSFELIICLISIKKMSIASENSRKLAQTHTLILHRLAPIFTKTYLNFIFLELSAN